VREQLRNLSAERLRGEAVKIAYGIHAQNPASLWEVIPWTWLADWFAPIQDLLQRYNGVLPLVIDNLCVMTTTETQFRFKLSDHPWVRWKPDEFRRTTKERSVQAPDGTLPDLYGGPKSFLDLNQVGILLSLLSKYA
jgi:hypothetical protein